jgi:alkanesulfonate monooxygenase SsuD/methylene tetrahydromethanopterin reductase-like flavin-dependent oxidoreductase (luciferase family)
LFLPPFGQLADPRLLAALAAEAEEAGWDGVFLWDHVVYRPPADAVLDAWIALAAIAAATTRVRLGPMVTPLARRRPHVVARQVAALDLLSEGRFVLGAGLGLDASGGELSRFGEELDDRIRAGMLDEALGLLDALLRGERVDHAGEHYVARDVRFLPPPQQQPRPPIWLAGRWPNGAPLRRAARYDGVFVIDLPDVAALARVRRAVTAARPQDRADEPFDFVVADVPGSDARPWRDAGATWWLTNLDAFTTTLDQARRLAAAPPKLD